MRTVDATLKTALATGHFVPYFALRVFRNGSLLNTLPVMKYKLTGTHLSITVRGMVVVSTSLDAVKVILDRGITSQGTNYILSSSKFSPIKGTIEYLGYPRYLAITTALEASLVPPKPISFAGDVSYHDAITSFCTAIDKTAVFKVPGAAYWSYKFLRTGRTVTFNDANRFLPLLRQKYFIFACDNGSEEILFYQAFDPPVSPDAQPTSLLSEIGTGYFQRRRFMARDEVGSVRYAGTAGDAIHNLGFLESTAAMPSYYDQRQPISVKWGVNLDYQDGDYQRVDDSYDVFPTEVTEVFDPKASPGWCTVVSQTEYFANTEGGALPSTIERVSNYTPLNVSTFNKNLDSSVNNIQALAERVDELVLGSPGIVSGAKVYPTHSGDVISIANNSYVKVPHNVESFDIASEFDNVTNYRFTSVLGGYYLISCAALWSTIPANKESNLLIYLNGSPDDRTVWYSPNVAGTFSGPGLTTIKKLNANDYLEMVVYQNTGGALNLYVGASSRTWLSILRLG
jgi:hypothetical protein